MPLNMNTSVIDLHKYLYKNHHMIHIYQQLVPQIVCMWIDKIYNPKLTSLVNSDDSIIENEILHSLLIQSVCIFPFDKALVSLMINRLPFLDDSNNFDNRNSYRKHIIKSIIQAHKSKINPSNLSILQSLFNNWQDGNKDKVISLADIIIRSDERGLFAPILGYAAMAASDKEFLNKCLEASSESHLASNLKAEAAYQKGLVEEAITCWQDSLRKEPLQPWVIYRLWEAFQEKPSLDLIKNKSIAILIYTFNKLETTLKTLKSVFSSNIGSAKVFVLNNGSTNFTPSEFEQALKDVIDCSRLKIIHLPTNIGAPAARNWLWELDEVKEANYVAYLDDDVLVPENWLLYYIQDLETFKDVVVVGPKVLNPEEIRSIQYIYRFFQEIGDHKIVFTHHSPFPFDFGQYSYRRPCLSVMGCCHLFHRKRCDKLNIPGFDIRFSPSQVDDLEHDLQVWKCGGKVLYDGRVEVVHLQAAGKAGQMDPAKWSHIWGNHMKMEMKYSFKDLSEIETLVKEADRNFFEEILSFVSHCLKNPFSL